MMTMLLKHEAIIDVYQLIVKLQKLCLVETYIATILVEVKQENIHICAKGVNCS